MKESATASQLTAWRGRLLHYLDDPGNECRDSAFEYYEDGLLVAGDGYITKLGPAQELLPELPASVTVTDCTGRLIVPGFVDAHTHFVQADVIASHGERLLDWLERYTYPEEAAFADPGHAHDVAQFFVEELLRNGSTSALVLGSVHAASADALFSVAQQQGMRLTAGKVMMDRNAPQGLCDTAESSYRQSSELIEKWHGRDRLRYAITPRFAVTSSSEQLRLAGRLAGEHLDCPVHSHLAENEEEVASVRRLYPGQRSYLDVYDQYDLLRSNTVLAHGIWLDDIDRQRLADSGASIAHCPTCNLFMGSGLFDLDGLTRDGIRIALGTDIGGGTSFSMLRVMHEAYKVAHLRQSSLSPHRAFYLATLAGARAMAADPYVGNFEVGKEADLLVLNPAATALLQRRSARAESLEELLFVLMMLGDDRAVEQVYLMGKAVKVAAPRCCR